MARVLTWVVLQRGFAVRCLDLVFGRVALEAKDLVRVDDGRLAVHVVFNVGHGEQSSVCRYFNGRQVQIL